MEVQSRPRARFPAGAGGAGPSGTHYALYRPQGSDGGMERSQIKHLRFRMLWVHSLRSSPSLCPTSESMGSHGKPHMGWHQRAPQRSSVPVAARYWGDARLPVPSHARIAGKGASPSSCAVCKIQPAAPACGH